MTNGEREAARGVGEERFDSALCGCKRGALGGFVQFWGGMFGDKPPDWGTNAKTLLVPTTRMSTINIHGHDFWFHQNRPRVIFPFLGGLFHWVFPHLQSGLFSPVQHHINYPKPPVFPPDSPHRAFCCPVCGTRRGRCRGGRPSPGTRSGSLCPPP